MSIWVRDFPQKGDMIMEHTPTTLRVCIDEVQSEGSDIKGRIYGIALKDGAVFSGSTELFMLADSLLDQIGKPQAYRKVRSFREKEEQTAAYCGSPHIYHASREIMEKKGKYLTRDVSFISRLRSSWQGTVKWVGGQKEIPFRSALELIKLMD